MDIVIDWIFIHYSTLNQALSLAVGIGLYIINTFIIWFFGCLSKKDLGDSLLNPILYTLAQTHNNMDINTPTTATVVILILTMLIANDYILN